MCRRAPADREWRPCAAHPRPYPARSPWLQDFFDYQGAVEVEIRLVRKKTVPIKSLGGFVPRPVGLLGIREDDARVFVDLIGLGPDVHIALRRAGRRQARGLEPRVLIAGVVDDQLNHHLHVALVSRVKEYLEVVQRSIRGIDVGVVRDIVAVVAQGRGKNGKSQMHVMPRS